MKENSVNFGAPARARELIDVKPVDILTSRRRCTSRTGPAFSRRHRYDCPWFRGLGSRERRHGHGCTAYGEIEKKLRPSIDTPCRVRYVRMRHKEVITSADEVASSSSPIPISSVYTAPLITAVFVIAKTPSTC